MEETGFKLLHTSEYGKMIVFMWSMIRRKIRREWWKRCLHTEEHKECSFFLQWLGIYRYNQETYVIHIHEISLVLSRDSLYSQNIWQCIASKWRALKTMCNDARFYNIIIIIMYHIIYLTAIKQTLQFSRNHLGVSIMRPLNRGADFECCGETLHTF